MGSLPSWSSPRRACLGAGCPAVGSLQEEGEAEDRSQLLPQRCFQTGEAQTPHLRQLRNKTEENQVLNRAVRL